MPRYYEREPTGHQSRQSWTLWRSPALNLLDEILTATQLSSDDVVVVDHARNLSTEDYAPVDDRIDAVQVQRPDCRGSDGFAASAARQSAIAGAVMSRLGAAIQLRFQTNVYFTPPGAQGFNTHHDTHDVFILQLEGSKRWRTYPSAVQLPLPGQRFFWKTPPSAPSMEFTLRQGDLFYCPRGIPHDARSTDEASVHVSLGALVGTWAELLLETIADVAMRDPAFRVSLPRGLPERRCSRRRCWTIP